METPEGDPGLMLTEIAAAEVGILVVGKERGQPMRHLAHGSVSSYCCECSRCPVFVVPPAEGAGR
ncbi:MAG: universal stress protein [Streptosporangiaceae bacterium]